ncbi:uncharacterized protein LOC116023674 [Ipomoea triloba]|uniref:uncharacterized protein LOC116023674 n=1 Tax=Ipomoea triloba TaxID=35885 RepID=UPI00125DD55F|nr:uncharacterized protein LOC116023674 [Ipomoea triloba]
MSINVSNAVSWARDIAPSHYMLEIESFSSLTKMLTENGTQFFKSKIFEASGYKWTFSLYPNGDGDGKGHISVSLCIEDTDALPLSWEIYTDLKFLIFDHKRDKYSIFQGGVVNRFHRLKPECGIAKLVPRDVFDDATNGYLVTNKCVFGVEVLVLDSKFTRECLSPAVKVDKTFTWKVLEYSKLNSQARYSDKFTAGSLIWKLRLDPLGDSKSYGENLAVYLMLDPQNICSRMLVYFMLRIRNQKSGKHKEMQLCRCFAPGPLGWGSSVFMSLTELRDSSKGFLVNDCIIIEALINNVATVTS